MKNVEYFYGQKKFPNFCVRTDQADVADGKILMTFGNRMTFVKNKRKCVTIFTRKIENKVRSLSLTRNFLYNTVEYLLCARRLWFTFICCRRAVEKTLLLLVGERLLLPARALSAGCCRRGCLYVCIVPGTDQMSEIMAEFWWCLVFRWRL